MPTLIAILLLAVVVGQIAAIIILLRQRQSPAVQADILNELAGPLAAIEKAVEQASQYSREELARARSENADAAQKARAELAQSVKAAGDSLLQQLGQIAQSTGTRLDASRDSTDKRLGDMQALLHTRLKESADSLATLLSQMAQNNIQRLESTRETVEKRLDAVREAVELRLKAIQEDNAKNLEVIRVTVDEKLQGTLEKRLGESFKLVSERLEQVYKGLGEMQSLAVGVGDLKKVLGNVKTRGILGEVQLQALLEDVLTSDQFAVGVSTRGGRERVDFAIKLPGRGADSSKPVLLPIDAKFPMEDYQRLVEAQERGDVAAVELATLQLAGRVEQFAKSISEKYINPPETTDFALMFLPTEALFAEVMRRPGLVETISKKYKMTVVGPTTLWAILQSLQMGFRTLAIEQRSSEVWDLLGQVKTEFGRYGEVLAKVQKKLQEASNTVDVAAKASRKIERRLKDVQTLPTAEPALLPASEAVEATTGDEQ